MELAGKKILVTSALPYANGPIHVGHLVEYIQTDIFVRYLKLSGEDAIYCCADDTHGTPIEIMASRLGKRPEELVAQYHEEHLADFDAFRVQFDSYYSTNATENKKWSDTIFSRLQEGGHIEEREVDQTYCVSCGRFLPDRYVKGICPKCGAESQYGDSCEVCNSSYEPVDLIEPHCILCGTEPTRKSSTHFFFKVSDFQERLRNWLDEREHLQEEVKNYVFRWMEEGLRDWDITRDPPYFGFNILDYPDKYYYVWLDAPIGYISSCEHYCKGAGRTVEEYWRDPDGRIVHFIGKDIIYFHFLFWPAMLMGSGLNLPESLVVHGFLTIRSQKMSKSRGTFITAKEMARKMDPSYLRFYFASNLGRTLGDMDLEEGDIMARVNSDLIGNFCNLANRSLSFLKRSFQGRLGPVDQVGPLDALKGKVDDAVGAYDEVNLRAVVRHVMEAGDLMNKYMQDRAPWRQIKENEEEAWRTLGTCVLAVRDLSILLKPIVPEVCARLEEQLGLPDLDFGHLHQPIGEHEIGAPSPLVKKLESIQLVEVQPAARLDVRTGFVEVVKEHPSADKLYLLEVDLGGEKRQIVAGLRAHYAAEELEGRRIAILCNLKEAKLRGERSQGMLLAADDGERVGVLVSPDEPGNPVTFEGVDRSPAKELTIDQFAEIVIEAGEDGVYCGQHRLSTPAGPIEVDRSVQGRVR